MQMYYTRRYMSMYIFSCRGYIFMLFKMNKENRKPRILGYCPNHTALKLVVRWKEKKHTHTHTQKTVSFQEKCLGFPMCLRLMSTHKRLKSGLDESGLAYNIKNLSFLNQGTIPCVSVHRDGFVVEELFPQTVVSASNFQWISEHVCALLLFQSTILFTELICLFLTPAHCSL